MKRTPLRRQSAKAKAVSVQRRDFVRQFLAGRECEMKNVDGCFGSLTVHESILRSHGGAIVPGEKARTQGQTFHALCAGHHSYVTTHPRWAREHGFMQRGVQ